MGAWLDIDDVVDGHSKAFNALVNLRADLSLLAHENETLRADLALVRPVLDELSRALQKFPTWPTDPLHAMGVVAEEVGELAKEVLQLVYEPHKSSQEAVRAEAIQAAAMLLRFIASLDVYEYRQGEQHQQAAGAHD